MNSAPTLAETHSTIRPQNNASVPDTTTVAGSVTARTSLHVNYSIVNAFKATIKPTENLVLAGLIGNV